MNGLPFAVSIEAQVVFKLELARTRKLSLVSEENGHWNLKCSPADEAHLELAARASLHVLVVHAESGMEAEPDLLNELVRIRIASVLVEDLHEHGPSMLVRKVTSVVAFDSFRVFD